MKARRIVLFLIMVSTVALAQSNPVPLINNPLVPDAVAPGGQSFTLTVNGTGFVPGSTVNWNNTALATTFVSSSQLTAAVPSWNIASMGTASISVANPSPGGGLSNVDFFNVRKPFPAVSFGQSSFPTGQTPEDLIEADLNHDGKLDLATLNGTQAGSLSILLGNGDGTFQSPNEYSIGALPAGLLAGDFNGDGILDLAFANYVSDVMPSISVMLGNGDGTFRPPQNSGLGNGVAFSSIVSADLNGDGKLDMAATESYPESVVLVLLGNGDGTFQIPVSYSTGNTGAAGVVAADVNSDGKLDLVTSVPGDPGLVVLVGNGDGTFQNGTETLLSYGLLGDLVAADLNGDNKLDLLIISNGFGVLLGGGDGTFQPPVYYNEGGKALLSLSVSDINGDGKLDVIAGEQAVPLVSVSLGNGDGTFQNRQFYPANGTSACCVVIGDFNGDGLMDLGQNAELSTSALIFPQVTSVLSTTHVNFGKTKVGSSALKQMVLSNIGKASFTINKIKLSERFDKALSETNTCGSTLAAGASCTITVTFTPDTAGRYLTLLTVSNSAANAVQVVTVKGTGTN